MTHDSVEALLRREFQARDGLQKPGQAIVAERHELGEDDSNYFGDFLVWWGLTLLAFAGGAPWWIVISPLTISFLLIRVSGVTLLEKSLKQRTPGYEEYMRRTSSFFPWPPENG